MLDRQLARQHVDLTRRFFLGLGAAGAAAWANRRLFAADEDARPLASAIAELQEKYITSAEEFGTVERGDPLPYIKQEATTIHRASAGTKTHSPECLGISLDTTRSLHFPCAAKTSQGCRIPATRAMRRISPRGAELNVREERSSRLGTLAERATSHAFGPPLLTRGLRGDFHVGE